MNLEFTPLQQKKLKRLADKHPDIDYAQANTVASGVNIIIDDVGLDVTDRQLLAALANNRLVFLEPGELMPKVTKAIDKNNLAGTLFLVPREGGLKITDRLTNAPKTTEILVTRDPQNPLTGRLINPINSEILLDTLRSEKPENVAVIDDVAVSGATAKFLREFSQSRLGVTYLWSLAVWLMAYPRDSRASSGIEGYSNATTTLLYAGETGRTPVNTLWDMLYNPAKKPLVVPPYAQKYSPDPTAFERLIDQLATKYQEDE